LSFPQALRVLCHRPIIPARACGHAPVAGLVRDR